MEQKEIIEDFSKIFLNDIWIGLKSNPKFLSSKYFYDEKGDEIFQQIMKLDEYYLTRAEYRILENNSALIAKIFDELNSEIQLIDLGAGDGFKTKILLKSFIEKKLAFTYTPIDISANAIHKLENDLNVNFPNLNVQAIEGEYFETLKLIKDTIGKTKLVLFLGSNIGNFKNSEMIEFLKDLHDSLNKNDYLLIGFDLMKDPNKILSAYNDISGITSSFNLNLLCRINQDCGADFNVNNFLHYPTYNPQNGETKSFLISKKEQTIRFSSSDETIHFNKWEAMQTEVSQKFTISMISDLAKKCGFEIQNNFLDKEDYYLNSLWKVM